MAERPKLTEFCLACNREPGEECCTLCWKLGEAEQKAEWAKEPAQRG